MQTSRRFLLLAGAAAATIMFAPGAAEAQLGGFIKKKVGDKIADKVLGPEQSGERRAPAPKFSEDVLEITEARLGQLLKGIEAEEAAVASAKQQEAAAKKTAESQKAAYQAAKREYDARQKEYEKAADAYTKCQMAAVGQGMKAAMIGNPAAMKMAQALAQLPPEERDAFQKRMEARQEKIEAAQERNDVPALNRLKEEADADMKKTLGVSMTELQAGGAASGNAMAQMQAQQAKCGPEPVAPQEPRNPADVEIDVRDSVRVAAVRASGLAEGQYAILRERVAAWLASKEKKRSLGLYGFTDGELAILAAKHETLKAQAAALLANDHAGGWYF